MTKILYIPTGEFISFLSSVEYDREYALANPRCPQTGSTLNYEESYGYSKGRTIEHTLIKIMKGDIVRWSGQYEKNNDGLQQFVREEFEIIYD